MSRMRHAGLAVRIALLGGVALGLLGCESFRNAAGISKQPPDEFAVVTKAPLVIPPEFNLRPPKPGAAPTNQGSPTDSAQMALFGDDPNTIAASLPSTFSPEEKTLLARTGGATANHRVRAQIAADAKSMSTADDSFTDALLFSSPPDPNAGHPVDADAEHDRMDEQKAQNDTPVEGDQARHRSQESATIDKGEDSNTKADDGGWFSGIF